MLFKDFGRVFLDEYILQVCYGKVTVYASSKCLTMCFPYRACLSAQNYGVIVRFARG